MKSVEYLDAVRIRRKPALKDGFRTRMTTTVLMAPRITATPTTAAIMIISLLLCGSSTEDMPGEGLQRNVKTMESVTVVSDILVS